MKKSGMFWLVVVISMMLYLYSIINFGYLLCFMLILYIIGLIIQNISDFSIFKRGKNYWDDEELCVDKIKELFLNKPYLFLMPHLFILGFIFGFYYGIINIGEFLSSFNDKIDNIKLIKDKKKSFNEFINKK